MVPPLKFLIADDHEVVRQGVKQMISDAYPEAEFGEASDAAMALEKSLNETWNLVVLDIHMPGRGGIETLVELKKYKPRVPVLVLSMYSEGEYAVRALKAGASAYINKGSVTSELVEAVGKALAGGRYITPVLGELLAADLGRTTESLPHHKLSDREYEVMKLIATGHSVKVIAAKLSLSEKTVFTYRARTLEKLGVESDVDVARYALRHHLVD
jgi:two-component system, NarL family, invasion response regulator UvrY